MLGLQGSWGEVEIRSERREARSEKQEPRDKNQEPRDGKRPKPALSIMDEEFRKSIFASGTG
jgi:hypothetical protein